MVRSQSAIDPTTPNAAAAAAWNHTYTAFSKALPKKLIQKKKKAKVVQSAYCAVCKIDCNSKDVLDKHKAGKKHLRNLNKLEKVNNPKKELAGYTSLDTKTSTAVNLKLGVAAKEDLETKHRKVLEGGASAAEVRVCILCGTVCNSQTVYEFHIAGKKHAAQLRKMTEAGAV